MIPNGRLAQFTAILRETSRARQLTARWPPRTIAADGLDRSALDQSLEGEPASQTAVSDRRYAQASVEVSGESHGGGMAGQQSSGISSQPALTGRLPRKLRRPIVIAAAGLLLVVLADRIAASMLGIGFFTPFAYLGLLHASDHATLATVIQLGGAGVLLYGISGIVVGLRAQPKRAPE